MQSTRKIYCIGESVYDILFKNGRPVDAKVGGAMVNTAVSLGRFGLDVQLVGDTGDDAIGKITVDFLKENKVGIDYFKSFKNCQSRLALAFVDEKNSPSYTFYKLHPSDSLSHDYPEPKRNDIIMYGSFFSIKKEVRKHLVNFLEKAREVGAILIYDPNYRRNHLPILKDVMPYIHQNIELSHITKGSDDDFNLIFGATSFEATIEAMKDFSPSILVYTKNKRGIEFRTGEERYKMRVSEIEPISAVGAGDAFNAGLIYYLIENEYLIDDFDCPPFYNIEEMIKTAAGFATDVCLSLENYVSGDYIKIVKELKLAR